MFIDEVLNGALSQNDHEVKTKTLILSIYKMSDSVIKRGKWYFDETGINKGINFELKIFKNIHFFRNANPYLVTKAKGVTDEHYEFLKEKNNLPNDCGYEEANLETNEGSVETKHPYDDNLRCSWKIKTNCGKVLWRFGKD